MEKLETLNKALELIESIECEEYHVQKMQIEIDLLRLIQYLTENENDKKYLERLVYNRTIMQHDL